MTNIEKFNAKEVRVDVSNQLEKMSEAKYVSLPEGYKETVYFALDAMSNMYDIEKAEKGSITKAFLNMFKNKLDYTKKHCYFFVQNDKNSPTGKSLRFGWQYQGLIAVAKAECGVVDVRPVLIYANDEVESHYEFGSLIIDKHVPTFSGDVIAGYCVVEFANKNYLIKYYPIAEMDKRRNSSKAPKGDFWKWESEMYEKTLVNATLKRVIETSATAASYGLHDEPEIKEQRQVIEVEAKVINQPEPTEEGTPGVVDNTINLEDV